MRTAQEVAGRVIDAVNAHDIAARRGLYAPDARTRRPGWPQQGGPQELLASYEMDFACVPDIHFGPITTLADGPHVVTEMRITGTNTGPTILGDRAPGAPPLPRIRSSIPRAGARCLGT
jgi:hypothetical protein